MALLGSSGKDFVSQMGTVAEQIKDTRIELRVAEQTRDGIKRQLEEQTQSPAPRAQPTVVPHIAVPELDGRIDALKRQLDETLRKYTEEHPDIIATRRLIAQLEDERRQEVEARVKAAAGTSEGSAGADPVTQQLKVALNEAESNLTSVRARLAEYEGRYSQLKASAESMPRIETEQTQLNRDYDIQRSQYQALVGRRETANLTGKLEDAGVAEFKVIDPPRVSPTPVAPNRLLLLGGVVLISMFAGLAASWLISQIRPTYHDARTLREITERPILGMISMLGGQEQQKRNRKEAFLFAGGLGGLVASYGAAFFLTLLATRGL
jgi:polysaccharide chain length determinant protein (PEP-CTERM system associated)